MTGVSSPPSRSSLPDYAHPPIVAATLGVFYQLPLSFASKSLAEFQRRLGPEWDGEWNDVSQVTPAAARDFGLVTAGRQLQNVLGDRILRLSPMHFAFTWLGTGDGRYPRYENLRDGFLAAWDAWLEQPQISPGQLGKWAVSYLNQIPQGTVWQSPADFSFFKLQPSAPWSERLAFARWMLLTQEVPDGLSVDWAVDAQTETGATPCIWLRLTATGNIADEASSLLDGMDAGRAAIVQAFTDLMSPAANAYWGLRRREK